MAWNGKRGCVHPRNNEAKLGRAFRQNFEKTQQRVHNGKWDYKPIT